MGKTITRWPRMLGYYREQDPQKFIDVYVQPKLGPNGLQPLPGETLEPLLKPKEECNPNIPSLNDATPLIVLCRKCKLHNKDVLFVLVELLIAKGATLDTKSSDGMSALMWAVMNDNIDLIKQLLLAGANPTICDFLNISLLDNCKSGAARMTVKAAVDAYTLSQREKEANENE